MDRIKEIENEIARTQKNKATAHHMGLLKARLAKLRKEQLNLPQNKSTVEGGFDVSKTGIARIGFIGFPSVGKSTLMSKLTGTYSAIADYEFTTLTTVPGVLKYRGAKIQILDLPGIIEGAREGKGRGRQVLGVAKTCSLLLIVLDVTKPLTHKKVIERELEHFGIRLNSKQKNVKINKKEKGGITVIYNYNQSKDEDAIEVEIVKGILTEYRINNAEVVFNEKCSVDEFIDCVDGNRKYVPCLYVLNKIDCIGIKELDLIYRIPNCVPVCAHLGWNFDDLLSKSWDYLRLIRVYAKPRGMAIDYEDPVILREERKKIEDFCNSIHKSIMSKFKYALVWGTSVKHNPQRVGKDHVLNDSDVVQIVKGV